MALRTGGSLTAVVAPEPLVLPTRRADAGAEAHAAGLGVWLRRPVRKGKGRCWCSLVSGAPLAMSLAAVRIRGSRRRQHAQRVRHLTRAGDDVGSPPPQLEIDPEDPSSFVVAILGDLHLDPRDLDHSFQGRAHVKAALDAAGDVNKFLVSLGDLGESKDCTETKQLFSGTTPCFELAREFLDGFEVPYDVVSGNHDLEGIDEFNTDEDNMSAFLGKLGKESPEFCHQIAEKTLLVGLSSTAFRQSPFTSHEVRVDARQLKWFEQVVEEHPSSEDWQIYVFTHAPIIGSGLRVLQEVHVLNGCAWLNHNDAESSKKFIDIVRKNGSIKAWFSGHFHLSHDYEDSITFPGGNNRGSCIFAQTGVMTARSSRDGRRQTRLLRGNATGFEICTIDHTKDGAVRLDATVTPAEECYVGDLDSTDWLEQSAELSCSVVVYAHQHADLDHDQWFRAYTPREDDGCYIEDADGTLLSTEVCWWHMKDGALLGVHNGMIIEYDASTYAPLGMVVSRDELQDRSVAVIDDDYGGSVLVLYDDSNNATVVQPNEDGTYWRRIVRNKMHRMREMRREAAARKWMTERRGEEEDIEVLSSFGPYKTHEGTVLGLTTKAVNPRVYKPAPRRGVPESR